MIFYRINPRQDFAAYLPGSSDGSVAEQRIPEYCRQKQGKLMEYLGDPPRKPGKRGDIHITDSWYFVRSNALAFIESAARGRVLKNPITIGDRQCEVFQQVWVVNYVDCLDVEKSSITEKVSRDPSRVGVIKRPVFDERRWDGSDLFVVPQDPSYCLFCSENFLAQWKAAKLKGAMFSRFLMDPEAIKC